MSDENDLENLLVGFVDGIKHANSISDVASDEEFTICVMEAYQCGLQLESLIKDLLKAIRTEYGITKADIARWLDNSDEADEKHGKNSGKNPANSDKNSGKNPANSDKNETGLLGNSEHAKNLKHACADEYNDADEYNGTLPVIPERDDNTEPVIEVINPMDTAKKHANIDLNNEYLDKLNSSKSAVKIANPLETVPQPEPKKPKTRRRPKQEMESVGLAKIMANAHSG